MLVILGVIAAITMPTLNLSGNKEKALEVKAFKVLGDIDKALDLIKFNDSSGDLFHIYDPYDSSKTISITNPSDKEKLKAVLAKYLKITNKSCNDTSCFCVNGLDGPNQLGIDQFRIPVRYDGIDYSCRPCNAMTGCDECEPDNPNRCMRCGFYMLYQGNYAWVNCTLNPTTGKCDDCGAVSIE